MQCCRLDKMAQRYSESDSDTFYVYEAASHFAGIPFFHLSTAAQSIVSNDFGALSLALPGARHCCI
jgi:hypothetical protein